MPFCADLFYRYYDGGASSHVYPTLLIHGLGGSHLSWPNTIRRIPGQRIIAVDLAGHGLSNMAAKNSARAHAIQLKEFIDGMGIYHFALAGQSMGGAVAYELAKLLPNRIMGLALISFGTKFNYLDELRSLLASDSSKEKTIGLLAEKGFFSGFPRRLRKELLAPLKKVRLSVLQADLGVCSQFMANHANIEFDFPVQLIAGQDDQFVFLSDVKKLKYCLPTASLKIIRECGHMAVFEQPETVRETLAGFLKEVTDILT